MCWPGGPGEPVFQKDRDNSKERGTGKRGSPVPTAEGGVWMASRAGSVNWLGDRARDDPGGGDLGGGGRGRGGRGKGGLARGEMGRGGDDA